MNACEPRPSKKLRVAILTLYPRETLRIPGGVRAVAYNLVQGLRRYDDLDIHVVHCHADIDRNAVVADGNVTVHYLAMPRRRLIPNMTASIGRMRRLLREIEPDVVNAHICYYALAAIGAGYPTVYTIHGIAHEEAKAYDRNWFDRLRYRLYAYYDDLAVQRAKELIAISDYVMEEYRDRAQGRWHRIDNPVTDDFFVAGEAGIPDASSMVVLFAGSITEVKDIITLLKAIALVRDRIPAVRLHLAGRVTSESYEREIVAYVQEHGLSPCVAFLGLLDRPALLREYAECALVALSSRQENAPMAVIEAMAVGRAVVCTRVGGVPGLVMEGETGYMVPPGDAEQMANRISELLLNPAQRTAMGQRAREQALKRFSVAQVAQRYRETYWQAYADATSALSPSPPSREGFRGSALESQR